MQQISKYLYFVKFQKVKNRKESLILIYRLSYIFIILLLILKQQTSLYRTIHQNISYVLRPHSTIFLCLNCYKKLNLDFNTANCSFEVHLEKNSKD